VCRWLYIAFPCWKTAWIYNKIVVLLRLCDGQIVVRNICFLFNWLVAESQQHCDLIVDHQHIEWTADDSGGGRVE